MKQLMNKTNLHSLALAVLVGLSVVSCNKAPQPSGTWTTRNELHAVPDDPNSKTEGFAIAIVNITEDGRFTEGIKFEMFNGQSPKTLNFAGVWKLEDKAMSFRRDGDEVTSLYRLAPDGKTMTGNVAGKSITLAKSFAEQQRVR